MKIERVILSILSLLPMKAVAYAADSRLTTLAGEDASATADWDSLLQQKSMLFAPMELTTTPKKAFERFLTRTGQASSPEAEAQFNELVEKMLHDGTITTDEKMIMSNIPSYKGG